MWRIIFLLIILGSCSQEKDVPLNSHLSYQIVMPAEDIFIDMKSTKNAKYLDIVKGRVVEYKEGLYQLKFSKTTGGSIHDENGILVKHVDPFKMNYFSYVNGSGDTIKMTILDIEKSPFYTIEDCILVHRITELPRK